MGDANGLVLGLYKGTIGIMDKKKEATIYSIGDIRLLEACCPFQSFSSLPLFPALFASGQIHESGTLNPKPSGK